MGNTESDKVIRLPKIICGEVLYADEQDEVERLEFEGGVVVEIPKLTKDDLARITQNRELLCDVPLGEVAGYIGNAGQKLLNYDDPLTKESLSIGSELTGYSNEMYKTDYFIIGTYVSIKYHLYDMIEDELGSSLIVDEWVRKKVGRVRAFPRGRALHILVGNVPLASMLSIVRSILTKNQTVIKVPSRDPLTSIFFARALIESNPKGHPLSKGISAFYAGKNSPHLEALKRSSDLICAWGKGSALEEIKKTVPHSIPYLEFGPKRSFSIIFTEGTNIESAAMKMAHDLSVYDQEACFSPQRLFVVGEHQQLMERIKFYMDSFARTLPRGRTNIDAQSHLYRTKLEAKFRQWPVIEDRTWTLIYSDMNNALEHPLGRTLFIHSISSLDELIPFVDEETQSVTVYPYNKSEEVANTLCPHGALRICELGLVISPRAGFTHDGMYPLNYFVRLANWDESVNYRNSYWDKDGFVKYFISAYGYPDIDNFGEKMLEVQNV